MAATPVPVTGPRARRSSALPVDAFHLYGATVLAVNVTATMGEPGTRDPVAMPPDRLAAIRCHELDHALRVLGVTESIVLGYEDGTLGAVDPDLGARPTYLPTLLRGS